MTEKNRTVVYHGPECADGFTAAWVAWLKYGDSAEYVPASYGDEPPDVRGKDVLILDFSYPRAVLERMHAEAASLRVIDHHKTAATDLEGLPYATFDMNRSGAGLAWDELLSEGLRFERPPLVRYVEDRDLWRWALPDSKAVNAYVGSVPRTMQEWDELAETVGGDTDAVVFAGKAILQAQERYIAIMRKEARPMLIADSVVPVVNTTHAPSELIGELATGHDFAVGWWQDGRGIYRYSLRSRGDFDVSATAGAYGGGGHKGAAGFESPSGPDELFRKP